MPRATRGPNASVSPPRANDPTAAEPELRAKYSAIVRPRITAGLRSWFAAFVVTMVPRWA
jgi:hypothetical protein